MIRRRARARTARVRRLRVTLVLLLAGLAAGAVPAHAHPLGNFSVNHLATVAVSADRVEIRYVLDEAEIPTFQARRTPRPELLRLRGAEIARGLALTVDGRRIALRPEAGGELTNPPGQGGLRTTRTELSFAARVRDPRSVVLEDSSFAGRVGWRSIVVAPGEDTAVRSSVPSGDPTDGLRRYPEDLLRSPLDIRRAELQVEPGDGTLVAPRAPGGKYLTVRDASSSGFAGLFSQAAAGEGVLLLLLIAALGWGALHALSPGHGKGMVAAYLAGTRGTARHAVGLGLVVTFTHTVGVFALGLVTLLLSAYILPEDLYPWLNLVSGLLVVVIGAAVLRSRIRWGRERRANEHDHHHHHHPHHHHHDHDHDHDHHHEHDHHHGPGGHSHDVPDRITWRGLLGMGAAAGLIPCPSALVVLLAAVAQQQVALGLLLILAFSLGLAATLTVLGLGVVYARGLGGRIGLPGGLTAALPAVSALIIIAAGTLLTAQAVPQLL